MNETYDDGDHEIKVWTEMDGLSLWCGNTETSFSGMSGNAKEHVAFDSWTRIQQINHCPLCGNKLEKTAKIEEGTDIKEVVK